MATLDVFVDLYDIDEVIDIICSTMERHGLRWVGLLALDPMYLEPNKERNEMRRITIIFGGRLNSAQDSLPGLRAIWSELYNSNVRYKAVAVHIPAPRPAAEQPLPEPEPAQVA